MKKRPGRKPAEICVVSGNILGWGEATEAKGAIDGLAQHFAASGENVTLLWVPGKENVGAEQAEELKKYYYQRFLVNLRLLARSKELTPVLWTAEKQSVALFHYLRKHRFDAVFIALENGLPYYSLLAKETGLFDKRPPIAVVAHAPTAWLGEADRYFLKDLEQVTAAFMEKYCAEMSDHLICASREIRDWMLAKQWRIGEKVRVLPALLPFEWRLSRQTGSEAGSSRRPPGEIAILASPFFRDGLTLVCDSLDRLAKHELPPVKVTAFGPFGHILGEHTGGMLLRRARRWPFELQLIAEADLHNRLDYIKSAGALAIIPSQASATGHLVAACLEAQIDFVATDAGANADRAGGEWLAAANPKSLSEKIAAVLKRESGPPTVSDAARDGDDWNRQLDKILDGGVTASKKAKKTRKKPLVSVVMVHHDRPQYLLQAVEAVERQTYSKVELILVDDGSALSESHAVLDQLEPKFKQRGWKIIRQENKYLGAARNAGAKAAKGERILFVDDDNALFRDAVATYVRAMDASNADICTSFQRLFYGESIPANENDGFIQYVPLGGSLDLGLIQDSFGDANAMIRRSVFEKIGYQIADYGYTAQDWQFFLRATLAGLKLRVIPEPLYWYRSDAEGMYRTSHWYSNRLPIFEAFRKHRFQGLEYVYHLVLAENVTRSEVEGFRENLTYSVSDERYLQLCDCEPNSNEAINTMAQIAAAEGRADTALALLGSSQQSDFRDRIASSLGTRPLVENALQQISTAFLDDMPLSAAELAEFEVKGGCGVAKAPLTYVEAPDRLFVQAEADAMSVAVLAAGCPASTVGISTTASLDQAIAEPAEFLVLLAHQHLDPLLAARNAPHDPSDGSTGWCRVSHPFESRELQAVLATPSSEPMNLIFAVRAETDSARPVLGCFSKTTLHRSLGDRASRRPRIGPPPTKLRAREWTADERGSVRLATDYPSELPLLLIGPGDDGIFLRPHSAGPVVASIEYGFPQFARRLITKAEIAHEESSPFEFAVALTRPAEPVKWTGDKPDDCQAFSGWLRVEETFKLHDLELEVSRLSKIHHTINMAIRLPRGSSPSPANAYFRKMIFLWDE